MFGIFNASDSKEPATPQVEENDDLSLDSIGAAVRVSLRVLWFLVGLAAVAYVLYDIYLGNLG